MRNVLLTGAALAALTTASYAADMPAYAPPEPVVAPFSWTGAYIGAHGGWNWADVEFDLFLESRMVS